MSDILLSKNFTLKSLCGTSRAELAAENETAALHYSEPLRALAQTILEPVCEMAGEVVTVTSAFRCAALNKISGGAENSQHVKGEAADFTLKNMRLKELFLRLRAAYPLVPYGQLILESFGSSRWLHISLGVPFRPAQKCGQSFILNNGVVEDFKQYKTEEKK
ncbi:hypothetical protein Dip510_001928 [Elusimicrobium posterum]|uniref:D-Ala-D-Ala carboxypeptidase family metallohydrolase n=1 Tax=Elusimicrobium posterum TaxID=3116653 RepID=UPI003C76D2D9